MAYIGQGPGSSGITDRTLDTVTSDGSTTSLVLTGTADAAEDVAVYFDGVMQRPGTDFTLANNTLTFTSPVPNGVFVCAYTGGAEHIGSPLAGSVTTDIIVDNAVIDAKVATGVDASKITGALGAFDGSALTGIASGVTKTSSDPTITDNPSSAGGLHLNTTTGEMFVCTDNTTDENVWVNVGSGVGNVGTAFGGKGGGIQYGYAAGGNTTGNMIDRFSLTNDENSTDHGDLLTSRGSAAGHSSDTHGYISAGSNGPFYKSIEKYSFEQPSNAQSHGDLAGSIRNVPTGQSSLTDGYTSGGTNPYPTPLDVIDKFSFSSNVSGTDHADLRTARFYQCGHSSKTHGWNSAGNTGSTVVAMIDNFSFATVNTTADVTTLTAGKSHPQGHSSSAYGFIAGGHSGSASTSSIDKFAFSNNALTSGIGNLNFPRQSSSSQSSNTHGYSAAGAGASTTSNIEKYSFDTGTTTANVGILITARHSLAGAQY